MSTSLQTILTSQFNGQNIELIQEGNDDFSVTREQLGLMLEYAEPNKSIAKIHERNFERLSKWSVFVKMTAPDGKSYETCVYSFMGLLEVCRFSNQKNANAVIDWAWETLNKLRTGSCSIVYHGNEKLVKENSDLKDKVKFYKMKSQVMEENTESEPLDYDDVAAMMGEYMKPPFGPKHLKEWLRNHGILTKAKHKNDKPARRYLNSGWFIAKTHKWKRGGYWRFETRYFITWYGFSKLVDLAIHEKMITPCNQNVFPAMFDSPNEIPAPKITTEQPNYIPNKPR